MIHVFREAATASSAAQRRLLYSFANSGYTPSSPPASSARKTGYRKLSSSIKISTVCAPAFFTHSPRSTRRWSVIKYIDDIFGFYKHDLGRATEGLRPGGGGRQRGLGEKGCGGGGDERWKDRMTSLIPLDGCAVGGQHRETGKEWESCWRHTRANAAVLLPSGQKCLLVNSHG